MVRRVVAVWLVLLALSPYTAPFCACDLSTLTAPSGAHANLASTAPASHIINVETSISDVHQPEPPVLARDRFIVMLPVVTPRSASQPSFDDALPSCGPIAQQTRHTRDPLISLLRI